MGDYQTTTRRIASALQIVLLVYDELFLVELPSKFPYDCLLSLGLPVGLVAISYSALLAGA